MLFSTKAIAVKPFLLTHKEDTHLPDLPLEIIEKIIYSVEDIPAIFHLLTTCRVLGCIAEAALYHTIDLTTIRSGRMERVVFRRWSGLIRHLLDSPRHAAMVFYILGGIKCYSVELNSVKVTQGRFFFTDHQTPPTSVDLDFHPLLPRLSQLRKVVFPRDDEFPKWMITELSSNVLRELEIYSPAFYHAAHLQNASHGLLQFYTLEQLNDVISRQQELRFLKVNPQSFPPSRRKLTESTRPLLKVPFQIEAIEGSLWLLKDVLPPTVLPRRLRFWDSMDPFTTTVTVLPAFWERLRHVRILSYCCAWEEEKWSSSEFPALLSQLPMLQTLEIVINGPGDSAVAIWMTSKFATSLPSNVAGVKELVVTMPSIQSRHLASLLGYLSDLAFKEIESLSAVEVGVVGQEYLRMTRENRVRCSGGVKRNDWWVYA